MPIWCDGTFTCGNIHIHPLAFTTFHIISFHSPLFSPPPRIRDLPVPPPQSYSPPPHLTTCSSAAYIALSEFLEIASPCSPYLTHQKGFKESFNLNSKRKCAKSEPLFAAFGLRLLQGEHLVPLRQRTSFLHFR
jgi:hypothetical protein